MRAGVDKSPDKLAFFPMPYRHTDEGLDQLEDTVRRAYDLAKADRPDLGVKIMHALDTGTGKPQSRVLVVIHEHRWVAGKCVNGCPDTRKAG